jgi:uncharacterized protein (TIGR03083 family)
MLAHLRSDVDRVLAVLDTATLTESVDACPGWTVRELVEHLGSVHRWATEVLRTGKPLPDEDQHGIEDLRGWFAAGADALLETLAAVAPAEPCWSFTSDKTKGFWVRRQALETVVHRWDAERALGEPERIDPELAADGVTEVLDLMTPRQIKLGRIPPLSNAVALSATDTDGSWQLGDGPPTATVSASAEVLLLLLWHRVDPGDPRVHVEGDAADVLRLALAP